MYLIEILHQTTTERNILFQTVTLYLIEILHQTTTGFQSVPRHRCCILLKFYIKPQLFSGLTLTLIGCILLKFYIKPQRFRRNRWWLSCCILLKFYIKPQLCRQCSDFRCVVSYWNSTSNHNSTHRPVGPYGVVSYWNSTSNHNCLRELPTDNSVVSYWNSTSNHNGALPPFFLFGVVSYWNSTSNHNVEATLLASLALYLIEILHQTTTSRLLKPRLCGCILLKFYIKPQRSETHSKAQESCILLKFYIKPQLEDASAYISRVVSYWNSTSNHNWKSFIVCNLVVVSYWNSTSNHNCWPNTNRRPRLYLIEILHQTTTAALY